MPLIGDQQYNFAEVLNSFWRRFFEDNDVLDSMLEGQMSILGQAYMDILQQVLNVNLDEVPIFREEFWHLVAIRSDTIVESGENDEFSYHFAPPSAIKSAPFLVNTVYNPTVVWERGSDYIIEDGVFKFKEHPVRDNIPGVASRNVDVFPVVFYRSDDARFNVHSLEVDTDGTVFHGQNADVSGTFMSTSDRSFSRDDIGRFVYFPVGKEIVEIKDQYDEQTVELNRAVGDRTDVRWDLWDAEVFRGIDSDRALYLESPALQGQSEKLAIQSVDGGKQVTLEEAATFQEAVTDYQRVRNSFKEGEASFGSYTNPSHVDVSGNIAYAALNDTPGGLATYRVNEKGYIERIGFTEISQNPVKLQIDSDEQVVYLALGDGSISAVDVSDSSSPNELDQNAVGSTIVDLKLRGDYLFAADEGGNSPVVMDVSDPSSMSVESTGSSSLDGVDVHGEYAYFTDASGSSLESYRIADPQNITLRDSLSVGTSPGGVEVDGSEAYVQEKNGDAFYVVNIQDPTSLNLLSTVTPEGGKTFSEYGGITSDGDDLYVVVGQSSSSKLFLYDTSDPSNLSEIANWVIGKSNSDVYAGRFSVDRERVYVPDFNNDRILSWRNPVYWARTAENITWRLEGADTVNEIGLWAPNAEFDFNDLYHSFGSLIDRFEPSSESYRRLLDGIFRYFMLQASMKHVESALNVMVGVPVVRDNRETVKNINETVSNEYDFVRTDQHVYRLPDGSVDPTLQKGEELNAFDSLTDLFDIEDNVTNPAFLYGERLPGDISDRPGKIDPTVHSFRVNTPGVEERVGDIRTYVGADYTGNIPLVDGADVINTSGLASDELMVFGKFFEQEDVGKTYRLFEGRNARLDDYQITSIRHEYVSSVDEIHTVVTVDKDVDGYFSSNNVQSIDVADDGNYILDADTSLGEKDGQYITLWDGTSGYDSNALYEILAVDLNGLAKIKHVAGPDLSISDIISNGGAFLNRYWEVFGRPPLVNKPTYNYADIFTRHHLAKITFNSGGVDVPYPRSEKDIQDVLLTGRPAHTYFLFEAQEPFGDSVSVEDFVESVVLVGNYIDGFENEVFHLGSTVRIGDIFKYDGNVISTDNISSRTTYSDGSVSGTTFNSNGNYAFSDPGDVGKRVYFKNLPNLQYGVYRIDSVNSTDEVTLEKVHIHSPDLGTFDGTYDWKLLPPYDTHTMIPIGATGSYGQVDDGMNDWIPHVKVTKP